MTVTLEEEYDEKDVVSPKLPIFPVTIPKRIRGIERTRQIRRKKQVVPEVNILAMVWVDLAWRPKGRWMRPADGLSRGIWIPATAAISQHNPHDTTQNVPCSTGGQTTWAMPGLRAETQPALLEPSGPLQHLPPLTLEDMAIAAGFSSPSPPVASTSSERSPRSPISSDVAMVEEDKYSESAGHNTAAEDEEDGNSEDESVNETLAVRPAKGCRSIQDRRRDEVPKRKLQKIVCEEEQVEEDDVEEKEPEGVRIDISLLLLLCWLRSMGTTILELLFAVFTFPPGPAITESVRKVEGSGKKTRQEGRKTQRLRRTPKPIAPRKEKVPWEGDPMREH